MAKVTVYIPTPFRAATGGAATVALEAATIGESLEALVDRYPALRPRVFDGEGRVLEHLNVYRNEEEMRTLGGLEAPLRDGDEVALVPAMAGGSDARLDTAPALRPDQLERYSRQILVEEVGVRGQRRLLESSALVVGAGGLGSPVALYLAAAGVGTIGIVDGDRVDRSNLERQILHGEADVGRPKTASAAERLRAVNPDVRVVEHPTVLSSANAFEILGGYDVIVNGSDNFPTRYLVNDACVLLGKPLVDASILKWEGTLSVYVPGQGCYRCLYPSPPPPGSVPSCAEAGILGAVAGVMGSLQAVEALKILLGLAPLRGESLHYDALAGRFRRFRWERRRDCPVCGDAPVIRELVDYEAFCGVPLPEAAEGVGTAEEGAEAAPEPREAPVPTAQPAAREPARPAAGEARPFPPPGTSEIRPDEAAAHLGDAGVAWFDVRLPHEFARGHVPGSRLLPLDELGERMAEVPKESVALFVCDQGAKSALAVEVLRAKGYGLAYNLAGGLMAWENLGLPLERGSAALEAAAGNP
ncbi:MAG: ThiF family adenylyltransferase [Clostridia bacterium]|nr:ThiF family adenylyltransferase [Clostridia bacterium]